MIENLRRTAFEPLDLGAIRRDNPLVQIVGAVTKLQRAGNEMKACCPFHADRSPSFTIFNGGQRYHCFGCGASGDVLDFIQRAHGVSLREAADMLTVGNLPSVHVAPLPIDDGADRIAEAKAIWRAAQPISGTLAETYLRSRGLHLPLPDSLRFTSLRYGKKGSEHPVLVAAVASVDDKLIGVQRTYLAPDGKGKATVPKPKLSLGRVSGGAIRLAPCAASLVVCEGLEDGLSLQQELGRAVWVAAGASMLPNLAFPAGVHTVAIGGDNDDAGRAAARKAGEAFTLRGIEARVFFPDDAKDFNQQLMERASA
jgi:DNA primase